jgi:ubiquitin-like modifier-activating enzyme ATG7
VKFAACRVTLYGRRHSHPRTRPRTRATMASARDDAGDVANDTADAGARAALLFEPPSSAPDASFWSALAKFKLDEAKLDDRAVDVCAYATAASHANVSAAMSLDASAFDSASLERARAVEMRVKTWTRLGRLTCANTLDAFVTHDRERTIDALRAKIIDDITSGRAERAPELLNTFACVAYADLKTWTFTYWFVFPALAASEGKITSTPVRAMCESNARDTLIATTCEEWLASSGASAWLLSDDGSRAYALDEYVEHAGRGEALTLAFADACCAMTHTGWSLRNLAILASVRWGATTLDVVCVRLRKGRVAAGACVAFTMDVPKCNDTSTLKVVGWERNARGKTGPRKVDLGASMDPTQLATQAVDLNLKLMRWRLLPELNQERLAHTKCLLIGAGTLGCAVARTLMGWGVRHITFVDSGRVSYSNPVRQSLFEFKDCLEGGSPKAQAAANKLLEIFPGVQTRGVMMSIPMPGHSVSDECKAETLRDVDALEALIAEHDVVYVLTDTRESRWLPALICADKGKLCINTALGFNTYLVMRHGCGVDDGDEKSRLGCYFCNDVMAPANSTKDRTLDQQCTVTRPGLAPIASALAAELMVALLHSVHGAKTAPPSKDVSMDDEPSPLGVVPHQIRGSVAGFTQTLFDAPCFPRCTACSSTIVSQYRAARDDFLMRVFDDPKTLEDATGLTELLQSVNLDAAAWIDDDDDQSGDDFD